MTSVPDDQLTFVDDVPSRTPIPATGLGHTTVLSSPDVRVIVLAFCAGHVLREHQAPFPLLMQALDGELLVRAGGRETRLVPGAILRLDAALRHEVEAVAEARLMLTLITRATA
jgi:quercetin dioxygenase-like cupin family protein